MSCNLCKKPTNKLCSRCKAIYYCSSSCQKEDYVDHVFNCPPKGGLKSAHYLVKNAFDNEMPTELAVLYEYGFFNCMDPQDKTMLLGLYIGLIKILGCSASEIHSWWKKGELSLKIRKTYDDANVISGYYSWFLKNEHFLQDLQRYEGEKSGKSLMDNYLKPYLSEHDQKIPFESLPLSKRDVVDLYRVILIGYIPGYELKCWVDFGFCTCKNTSEETRLCDLYRELIVQKGCKIDEFNDAYVSGSVIDLLKRKCADCSWLSESRIKVRAYRQPLESVYYLKQYVLGDSVGLRPSVTVDYGFVNCRTEDEKRKLKKMYEKLIEAPQFDPLDLHKACLAGKIFNYVSSIIPNRVLRADFLKNHYPLKDF